MFSVTVTLDNFSFNLSRNIILTLPKPLQKVEVGSTLCNGEYNKNTARHVHSRACYTKQRSAQLVRQRRKEIARQVATAP